LIWIVCGQITEKHPPLVDFFCYRDLFPEANLLGTIPKDDRNSLALWASVLGSNPPKIGDSMGFSMGFYDDLMGIHRI